jgi:hypothetical protein
MNRFSCKVTPRRLKCWTLSIMVSYILRRILFTCLFPNLCIIYLDFFTVKDSLLMFSHSFILFSSIFKWCSTSLGHMSIDWIVVNKVLSSAYIIYLNVSHEFDKSVTYIKNKSGPHIDPCGTLVVIGRASETVNDVLFSDIQVTFY